MGSSPLTRGKHIEARLNIAFVGLIPAHAGKTCRPLTLRSALGAHPRSRGENARAAAADDVDGGSSPLTRGKRRRSHRLRTTARLIPAHAGKTASCLLATSWAPAHPRSRGENLTPMPRMSRISGSSPLTRGKQLIVKHSRERGGLIPAHAGKTTVADSRAERTWAHPRSRGENYNFAHQPAALVGSSPLTRGKQSSIVCPAQR